MDPIQQAVKECPNCGGSGLIDDCPVWCSDPDHQGICPVCGGSGEVATAAEGETQ